MSVEAIFLIQRMVWKNGLKLIENILKFGLTLMKKTPPTDAEKWQNVKNKFNDFFSTKQEIDEKKKDLNLK